MPDQITEQIFDALVAAQKRGLLPTALGTADLRELGQMMLSRSVFTARGTSVAFVSELKRVVDEIASGNLNEASARLALKEMLKALSYTPEGGFPDAPNDDGADVPPAIRGTLQDLSSHRRLNLIIETQRGLTVGAGQKMRGSTPERLELFPAWELYRQIPVEIPRDWPARWAICGGTLVEGGRMIAAKGDPIWGELGGWENFEDALGVDHPPFAFNSGMGWLEVSKAECRRLGITGPNGQSLRDFHKTRPFTMTGAQSLPAPVLSTKDLDPELKRKFLKDTGAVEAHGHATTEEGRAELDEREAAREARRKARMEQDIADAAAEYERRGK